MSRAQTANSQKTLVIDVGGSHIKLLATGQKVPRKIPSGPTMTARKMVKLVKLAVRDWKFNRVSMGYPGPVIMGILFANPTIWVEAGLDSTFAVLLDAR